MPRASTLDPNRPLPAREYRAPRSYSTRGYDPYRQYAEANRELSNRYGRQLYPERYKWGRPEADEGPGTLSYRQQAGYTDSVWSVGRSVFGTKTTGQRVALGAAPIGGSTVGGREIIWCLVAAGAVYGMVAARGKRGFTPLVFAGIAALLMAKALKGTWDEAFYSRLGI